MTWINLQKLLFGWSFDHRLTDAAPAARFLQPIKLQPIRHIRIQETGKPNARIWRNNG